MRFKFYLFTELVVFNSVGFLTRVTCAQFKLRPLTVGEKYSYEVGDYDGLYEFYQFGVGEFSLGEKELSKEDFMKMQEMLN